MIRILLVGYCYGIRHERRLCQEVALHLAYRWFCKLDLDDKVPHHSTFSVNRLGRFRESEILRHIFERVVAACMAAGLVKGEGFAVDASVMEANASRYHGKAPDELDWTDAQRQKRAVAEYLAALEAEAQVQEDGDGRGGGSDGKPTTTPDRKPPKVISPSDPSSAWTAKANKRVQFGYGLNYLIDVEHAIIVDVEATPARTYDEVASTKTMIERTEQRLDLKPDWLTADTAYGTGRLLAWLLGQSITPHIPHAPQQTRSYSITSLAQACAGSFRQPRLPKTLNVQLRACLPAPREKRRYGKIGIDLKQTCRHFTRLRVTSEMGEGGCETAVSRRIGGALTQGFLPCDDGLVKATKLDKRRPHPNESSMQQRIYRAHPNGTFKTSDRFLRQPRDSVDPASATPCET
jgi:hypothetical protein